MMDRKTEAKAIMFEIKQMSPTSRKEYLFVSNTKRDFLEWILNGFINGDIQQIVKCEDCKFYCSGNVASWCEHNDGLCYEMSEPNNGEHWCCFGERKYKCKD